MSLPSFVDRFARAFTPEPFRQLARQTGWCQRQGKIDAFEFLTSLIFGQMSASRQTLSSQSQALSEPVSRQAIDQRFTPAAVEYGQAALVHIMTQTLEVAPTHPQAELLRTHFKALYLLDTTGFDCAESLQDLFPACGGDGSSANVKVLLRYELIAGRLEPLQLLAGKCSDQGLTHKAAERLLAGELQLHDKGFYGAEAWAAARARSAFLLTPLPHNLTLWVHTEPDAAERPLPLAAVLEASTLDRVEWAQVALGTKGHRVENLRLVAFRLHPESAARQRAGLRESMRKQGRTPSAKALSLAGWLLLLTNAPADKLPSPIMGYLYRMRWQIELIFRQMKSVLRLDKTESANPCRVQTEIWARLIAAVLVFLWHTHASAECWRLHQGEASFEKISRMLQHWGQTLARALLGPCDRLRETLRNVWEQMLRNGGKGRQKNRRNSWQNLYELWLSPGATAV